MGNQALSIPFSAGSSSATLRRFVNLEPVVPEETNDTVTMFDINQMVARAKSGISALTYVTQNCPLFEVDGNTTTHLGFYVWPSSKTLDFKLETSVGEISEATIVNEYTEFSVLFGSTDSHTLDFILEGLEILFWEINLILEQEL